MPEENEKDSVATITEKIVNIKKFRRLGFSFKNLKGDGEITVRLPENWSLKNNTMDNENFEVIDLYEAQILDQFKNLAGIVSVEWLDACIGKEYIKINKSYKKAEKIPGIYPGCVGEIDCFNDIIEQNLYYIIKLLSQKYVELKNTDEKIEEADVKPEILENLNFAIQFCMYQTRQFGTEIPEATAGKSVELTVFYWSWFNWWDNYFQKTLSKEEYENFLTISNISGDTSMFKPEGSWKDN